MANSWSVFTLSNTSVFNTMSKRSDAFKMGGLNRVLMKVIPVEV